jgi:GNAT superfamily N-acetyltransferase
MSPPSRANPPSPRRPGDGLGGVVRAPVPEDVERLAVINRDAWRSAYADIVPTAYLESMDLDQLRAKWTRRVAAADGQNVCRVADRGGVLASYAVAGPYRRQQDAEVGEDTRGWGELDAIYTHPSLSGRGAGSAVHDAVLDVLRSRGFTRAALWVLRDNVAARRWYGDREWRPDGVTSTWLGAGAPLVEVRLVRPL